MDELLAIDELLALARGAGLKPCRLAGRELIPVVQGGMGVGISAGGLAGTVASFDGMGSISSVDLRRLHPDLFEATRKLEGEEAKLRINAANLEALDREIRRARAIARGLGLVAVNVMRAVEAYAAYVRQALASGADAIVVGAGLPLDLPDLGREHPRLAGGHLGAAKVTDLGDRRFDCDVVPAEVRQFLQSAGIEKDIPLIAAGGVSSREDILRLQALGASAVQLGTAFAVTQECDADPGFKHVLASDKVLGNAFAGDIRKGLFFGGAGRLPFGDQIRPVKDLLYWLLGGVVPTGLAPEGLTT